MMITSTLFTENHQQNITMKTILFLLCGLILSISATHAQMNGYVAIQAPYGGIVMAPRAGSPMYPVPAPAINNFYGGGCYGRGFGGYVVPVNYGCYGGGFNGGAIVIPVAPCGGFYNTGRRVYGGTWNGFKQW